MVKKNFIIYLIGLIIINFSLYAAKVEKLSPKVRIMEPDTKSKQRELLDIWRQQFINLEILNNKEKIETTPRVIADKDGKVMSVSGDQIYVDRLDKIKFYKNMAVYRLRNPIKDVTRKKIIGYPFFYLANAKLVEFDVDNHLSLLTLSSVNKEVITGDRVLNKSNTDLVKKVRKNRNRIKGNIVDIIYGVQYANEGTTVVIDLGKDDKIAPGDLLQVERTINVKRAVQLHEKEFFKEENYFDWVKNYFAKKEGDVNARKVVDLPKEKVATILVYRVFDKTSLALVTDTKEDVKVKNIVRGFI